MDRLRGAMTLNGHLDLAALPIEKRVKALRQAMDLTQQELADEVGLNVRQIKRFESGSIPSEESAHALAAVAPRRLKAKPDLFFEPVETREGRLLAVESALERLERRVARIERKGRT